jgi:hypothetical protein
MTNLGSGYTSAPTVTFSGGGGSGATGSALVGLNNNEGKVMTMMFNGAATASSGTDLTLKSALTASASTVLSPRGAFRDWYEMFRGVAS